MRFLAVLFVFFIYVEHSCARPNESIGMNQNECPSGEYHPGPGCAFEVICGLPSAHSARRHYCDCWCNPGLIRNSLTGECVEECP